MARIPVSSSNVISIGYDEQSLILEVEYKQGLYQYHGVPLEVYTDLILIRRYSHLVYSAVRWILRFPATSHLKFRS